MKFSYYPGCSLEATAKEYDLSARAVSAALEVELSEIQDWNCCGATSAHSTNHFLGIALPARNLALAQEAGLDVAVPCSACYSRLKMADYLCRENEAIRNKMEDILGFKYQGKVKILSLLEVFTTKVGLMKISAAVTRPLAGLKLTCYYGCLLVRPPELSSFPQPEYPVFLDELMNALGAESVPWSYKVECCGASLGLVHSAIVRKIVSRLLRSAKEAGAQAVVTACPLCQANLEMRREKEDKDLPVFYFTELMGISFGLKNTQTWLKKHLIDPVRLLASVNLAG